jgi:hypothetical protein
MGKPRNVALWTSQSQSGSALGTKKTGPLRARSEFASVGAPAITFLEGKNCLTAAADLGGSLATACPQQNNIMQSACAPHNTATGMPAMQYRQDCHENIVLLLRA